LEELDQLHKEELKPVHVPIILPNVPVDKEKKEKEKNKKDDEEEELEELKRRLEMI